MMSGIKIRSAVLFIVYYLANMASVNAACVTPQCIETGNWRIGIAVGAGVKSNPLVGGDAIPLIVLPDIAYYGDNIYLDNAEVGYQWQQNDTYALDAFISINSEKAFFTFWHPSNVFLSSQSVLSEIGPSNDAPFNSRQISIDQVSSRRWAVDAGIRLHKRSNHAEWQFTLKTDVSNVHNGQQFDVAYRYRWQLADWHFTIAPTLSWKSSKLIDYYYGIDEQDNVFNAQYYHAQGGWQPSLALSASKAINPRWQWLMRSSVTLLHSGMTDSPLVAKKTIGTVFLGIGYVF
ncbi:MipA/OmpV family protein [Paraglaciecola polaris]